jgi:dTDP-glucose 4,6-dehydratase
MKTYAVLGSNCFTGSHIVDALMENPDNRVIGISRSPEYDDLYLSYKKRPTSNFQFHQIDLVRQFDDAVQLLEKDNPQVVINVAGLSEVGLSNLTPVEYYEINTVAVVKLCNYLRQCSYLEQYVHVSSGEVFGSCNGPVTEETNFNPSTPYAASKAAADMHLNTLIKNFGFPAIISRSTNVFGRHQQLFKIIPRAVIYLQMGQTIELHGGGLAIKSFIHIRDVVRGMMMAMERNQPGTYHFTVTDEQTIADLVHHTCDMMESDFSSATRTVGERLGQDARYWLDCSKAQRDLGWKPQVAFDDGVREVIEWIKGNWAQIQNEPLEYIHKS